jgi:hypothetical protein
MLLEDEIACVAAGGARAKQVKVIMMKTTEIFADFSFIRR